MGSDKAGWGRLLADCSGSVAIGDERVLEDEGPDGLHKYMSPHGSMRYVWYVAGQAVSALQVAYNQNGASIANVFTAAPHRRRGHATRLLIRARQNFPTLRHSQHLSPAAREWIRYLSQHHIEDNV